MLYLTPHMYERKRYDLWAKVRHDLSKIFGEWYILYVLLLLVNDLCEMFDRMTANICVTFSIYM